MRLLVRAFSRQHAATPAHPHPTVATALGTPAVPACPSFPIFCRRVSPGALPCFAPTGLPISSGEIWPHQWLHARDSPPSPHPPRALVTDSAHYMFGGLWVGLQGETNVKGLYVDEAYRIEDQ
ncbi:hypothetical protein GUJ93_ZPchr0015g6887 [Zizania palustris]|uniref:Uncharacterized protein n=1 Tax=Zizania palustris TaxID=103762 RepID=A0A8J5TGI9_ZIZPA|nr:hypothetical protein GUJ93_ZPchr0015g6887 [Zizania palustris]